MVPWWGILMGLVSASAGGGVAVSLEPGDPHDRARRPYATATLRLTNATGTGVETVLLRPDGGGPTVRGALAVAPGQRAEAPVPLPAIWTVQTYEVTALDPAGRPIGSASAEITWPAEAVATDDFLDDAYALLRDTPATWALRLRRNAVLVLAAFAVASAGTLFVRRRWLRLAALAAVIAAAVAAAALIVVPRAARAVEIHRYLLERFDGEGEAAVESLAVVSARRTATVEWSAASPPYPVYPDREAAAADDSLAEPDRARLLLPLRPGQVRIVRPGLRRAHRPSSSRRAGTFWPEAGGLTVHCRVASAGALLMFDDTAWAVEAAPPSETFAVRQDAGQLIWPFLDSPAGRRLGRRQQRLLKYWRSRHRRQGQLYLIEPGEAGDLTRLTVVRLVLKKIARSAPVSGPAASRP